MKGILKGIVINEVETYRGPLVDLYETESNLVFEADMPGININNVSVKIYEDLLIIEFSAGVYERGHYKYLCMERSIGGFKRIFKIPVHIDAMAGEAFYKNGVLTIRFPKLKDKLIILKIDKR